MKTANVPVSMEVTHVSQIEESKGPIASTIPSKWSTSTNISKSRPIRDHHGRLARALPWICPCPCPWMARSCLGLGSHLPFPFCCCSPLPLPWALAIPFMAMSWAIVLSGGPMTASDELPPPWVSGQPATDAVRAPMGEVDCLCRCPYPFGSECAVAGAAHGTSGSQSCSAALLGRPERIQNAGSDLPSTSDKKH